jgi:hypothetical protein
MVIHWVMTLFWMMPSLVETEKLAKTFNIHHNVNVPKEICCGLQKAGKVVKVIKYKYFLLDFYVVVFLGNSILLGNKSFLVLYHVCVPCYHWGHLRSSNLP